ncbi:copper resistance D family protein [Paenibacillus septentrionalis]|uniref:Copper resistance D family protein n=1 Tax=Paenibacillus septentrionalis TaxID=429342 RepID=A0ABW1V0Q9_9BACL
MPYIAEFLLYICFAITMGSCILQNVPQRHKPTVVVPKALLLTAVLAIPVLSYIPLHMTAIEYAESFKLSYAAMMKSILLDLSIGEAWIWTTLGALGLAAILGVPVFARDRHMPKVALILVLLLTFWLGYGSHVATLDAMNGLIVHTGHFTAVAIWLGILFVVSWFAQDDANWSAFLKWFSPLAIVCVLIALIAGITLMTYTTPEYTNALMLSYGQLMLLKHAAILPLLWLALSNGFIYPRLARNGSLPSQRRLLKVESLLALVVLGFTAVMGQTAPPHNVLETLRTETPSSLFTMIYQGSFTPDLKLIWQWNLSSGLLIAAALLMLYTIVIAFKQRSALWIVVLSVLLIVFVYFAVMFGIVPAPTELDML